MRLRNITERFDLPGPDDGSVRVGEAIDALGIDKVTGELYHVVIEDVPCAVGGKVNINERIYVTEELTEQHEALCGRATEDFIDGEQGHPQGGETWRIPVRFLGGRVQENTDGTVTTLGRYGILKTSHGNDVHTLWKAGFPIGVSLRGRCFMSEAVLEADHPYAPANPQFVGSDVTFCTGLRLHKHDVVRRASFDTYFPASEEAALPLRAALNAVAEAGVLPLEESPQTDQTTGTDAEEDHMDPSKLLEAFLADHPEAAALYRSQVACEIAENAPANPLSALSGPEADLVARIAEAVKPGDEPEAVPAEILRLAEEASRAQAENATLRTQVEEQGVTLSAIQAELAATKLRSEILEAVDAKAEGKTYGVRAKAHVLARLDRGKVTDVAEAEELFDEVTEMLQGVQSTETPIDPSAGATETSEGDVVPAADPETPPTPTAETVQAPGALPVAPGGKAHTDRIIAAIKARKRTG